jgi:ABC-2 type transport system ATP-binding protein
MDEAEALSDHVHIVDAGRVIASGTPQELVHSGAENTVRFTAQPALDTADLIRAISAKVEEKQPGHYVVVGTVDPQLLAALTAWCATQGVLAESILVQRQTLEDRFLELTGRALR